MSKAESTHAVLLQSTNGYKETKDGSKLQPVEVREGSLLVYLDFLTAKRIQEKYEQLMNYKVVDRCDNHQSEAFLFSTGSSILRITKVQQDFLLGIRQTNCRVEVLKRLEWTESLALGSEVYVTIATIPAPVKGIVRYIGKLPGEEGRKFGIEMMEHRGEGTHDGEFKGHKYFKCDKDCAMFVAMDQITNYNAAEAAKVTKTPEALSKPLARDDLPIKINDHVIFYDKCNILFRGVAKWIGTNKSAEDIVVGIEVEGDLSIADFPNHVIREDEQHFTSKTSKIFLPIAFVEPDTSRNSGPNCDDKEPCSHSENVPMPGNPHNLVVGSSVRYLNTEQYGIIKWIGDLPGVKATYAGVEMEDYVDKFAGSDGSWMGVEYFSCKPNRGKFVILSSLHPDQRLKKKNILSENSSQINSPSNDVIDRRNRDVHSADSMELVDANPYNLEVGSVIQYVAQCGVIKWIGKLSDQEEIFAGVEMDADINEDSDDGVWVGTRYYQCKPKRGMFMHLSALKPARRMMAVNEDKPSVKPAKSNAAKNMFRECSLQNPHNFTVGCTVQYGKPAKYGVIKWIGNFPNDKKTIYAGLVMDEWIVRNAHDGVWNGEKYYDCEPNRGTFVPLKNLKPCNEGVRKCSADNIILKYADETVTTEHRSLISRQPSVDCVLSSSRLQPHQNPYKLEVGSTVQYGKPVQYGVIRWIGKLPGKEKTIYAGVEMDNIVNKCTDGVHKGVQYFKSQAGRGIFVKLQTLQPDKRFREVFEVGSRVQFGRHKEHGVITWMGTIASCDEEYVKIVTEDNKESGLIPISTLKLDSRCVEPHKFQHTSTNLEIGSLVQFGNPVRYGVIKRIETAVDTLVQIAEVETENSQLKKIPLTKLQPDNRFIIDVNKIEGNLNPLQNELYKHDETMLPVPPADKLDVAKHTDIKGIQGYKNSCYLDATLYGMFTFSDAFDILILEEVTTNAEELKLQKRLKSEIVYPLRKKGIVIQESVEEFREHLAKLQNMKGFTSEEKDPEEFLNILFKHVLHLDPFITIRRPSGIDKEFFVQLFVEPDENEPVVNTQGLLCKMFQEQNITFVECPTRLLMQMPRYGKRFKSFQRIIPSLKLNVAPLCMITGLCSECQYQMGFVCNDCSNQRNQIKFYCSNCSPRWHYPYYNDHKHELNSDSDTGTLQLLSVLCIETSHYVCFTRITGSGKDEWVFFDSMAERQDNGYNLPKVTHCTDQLQEFVYGDKDIGKIPSKTLPELVRRFVEDAYLCIYIDHNGVMYQ